MKGNEMTVFAITPSSATRILSRGPQNIGYSDNIISLLATNCDAQRTHHFIEHKLWIKEGQTWRELATYHRNLGWRTDLTDEIKGFIDEALDIVSLETYLRWIAGNTMTRDLAHWAESRVETARQLADYLDGCVGRALEKDQ